MNLLKMCGPQIRHCLLTCVETVKYLDNNRYVQLTRWSRGNASALCARCPAFNSRLCQGVLCLIFVLLLLLLCLIFFVNNTFFSRFFKFLFAVFNLIHLVYVSYAHFLTDYRCIRYRPSILNK